MFKSSEQILQRRFMPENEQINRGLTSWELGHQGNVYFNKKYIPLLSIKMIKILKHQIWQYQVLVRLCSKWNSHNAGGNINLSVYIGF